MFSREQLPFGEGHFVGPVMDDPSFFELPVREQARILGWADSCPVVTELTDPDNPNPGRGPEAMLERYGQINFWFGFIVREVAEHDPQLAKELMTPADRKDYEPVGKYERESVPPMNIVEIAPMGQLAGYGLPRIFIEQIGLNDPKLSQSDRAERLELGVNILEAAIDEANTPIELLTLVAEGVSQSAVPPLNVLKHCISQGWLDEHNSVSIIQEFQGAMFEKAPNLWEFYSHLTDEQKMEYKLV